MGVEGGGEIEGIQLVTFQLAEDVFAVEILQLKEICKVQATTPVPNTSEFVLGVINLRGKIVPVIDLRKKFNLKTKKITDTNKIMVTRVENKLSGFVVDAVLDIHELPEDAIDTPSRALVGFNGEYIKGMVKIGSALIVVLDIEYILTSSEKIDLSTACYGINSMRKN